MAEAEAYLSGPNQPKNFKYPFREFGKTKVVKRCFQKQWYGTYSWLDYDETDDVVYCHVCRLADSHNKLNVPLKEPTFTKTGFSNWKDATFKFRNHEKSTCHKIAVDNMIVLPHTTMDVGEMLAKEHEVEKRCNRKMLLYILKAIRFLSRQGLALRGDDNESNSNFFQALKLFDSEGDIKKWLERKQNKYTSPDIQNETLKIMALQILCNVANKEACIHAAKQG